MPATEKLTQEIAAQLEPLGWQHRLAALCDYGHLNIVFSTSFSFEDQALTHAIAKEKLPVRIFTLDTGRLFYETYRLYQQTREQYGVKIDAYYPDAQHIEEFVTKNGINGFYDSVENRKTCCAIRKVEPLNRALKGADIWISGVRNEQSDTRENLGLAEWDAAHGVVKLYPLIDVKADVLWAFIRAEKIPYNPLHDHGYSSIGCAPCTRAIKAGEHPRAGRWWWEQKEEGEGQECGIHIVDGKVVRARGNADA